MRCCPLENFRSPAAASRFLLTMAVGLAADLWTKVYAFKHLCTGLWQDDRGRWFAESTVHEFIPGWLHFKVTVNQGAVFGIGQGNRALFLAVSALAIVFLTYLFVTSGRQRFYQFILGMLLAGVLGNMYDRVAFGYVRDMIYVLPEKYVFGREAFPWIFNVADMLLCVGVGLMIAYSLLYRPADPAEARDEPGPGDEAVRATDGAAG